MAPSAVVDDQLMARLEEIGCHRQPHAAEADESDFHGVLAKGYWLAIGYWLLADEKLTIMLDPHHVKCTVLSP
jgi:hypothetical protein